jgi:aminoglycoside phosphotransferase (APT) family kinase protein
MAFINRLEPVETTKALEAWLACRMPDVDDVRVDGVDLSRASGMSHETVLFDASWRDAAGAREERLVARIAPVGPGLFPDYDLGREWNILTALEPTPVPVPRVRFYEPDPAPLGAPFLVTERRDGRGFPDDPPYTADGWFVALSADDQRTVYRNALGVVAALHAVDPAGLTGVIGRTGIDAEIDYYRRFAEFSGTGGPENPTLAAALDWVTAHRPADPGPDVICWGDARLANFLVGDDLAVTAALDWEEATVGPAGIDLGYWLYSIYQFTEGFGIPVPAGFPDAPQAVALYERLTGREFRDREYFEVLGAVRAACILGRAMNLMVRGGVLPADSDAPVNNPATQLLARRLGLPTPGGLPEDWTGRR